MDFHSGVLFVDDGVRYFASNEQGRGFDARSEFFVQNETATLGGQVDHGSASGAVTNFYTGHLAELLVYDRAVTDRDLRSLSNELPELEVKKIGTTKCL